MIRANRSGASGEDTLIFIPLGINVLPLLLIRLTAAVALTLLVARLWRDD